MGPVGSALRKNPRHAPRLPERIPSPTGGADRRSRLRRDPRRVRFLPSAANTREKGGCRMTKKTAFWIFLLGTLSSAVLFLAATWDTQRQVATLSNVDKLSDQVVAGKWAFEKYNCNDCHTILGFGGYYAPDLTRVVQRIGAGGGRYRIKSPELAFANSWRKMPNLQASDAEVEDLGAFFAWVAEIHK